MCAGFRLEFAKVGRLVTNELRVARAPTREAGDWNHLAVGNPEWASAMETVARVGAIASSSGSPGERAATAVEELRTLVPFDAVEVGIKNPLTDDLTLLTGEGYSEDVLEGLHSRAFVDLMYSLDLPNTGRPTRMKDLPGDPLDNWAVSDMLLPAGYREGMTMALRTSDGRFVGAINLSTSSAEHPSDLAKDAIAQLCVALGNMVDPGQSARWISMLLGSGSMAIGLAADGETIALPGLVGHHLLSRDSELIRVAQRSSVRGTGGSFMWPDDDDWYKVRVVPCRGDDHLASVVSLDSTDIGPLTRRELEVLTLAAEGLSNHEIAQALVVSDRTVATHVEHVLDKLEAPNRAAAASYALREGLILGKVDRRDVTTSAGRRG